MMEILSKKFQLNLIALLLSCSFGNAQEINFEWETLLSVPDKGTVRITSKVVHNNHLYFTGSYAGEEVSFGKMTLANTGNRDYIVGCLSLDGEAKWLKTAVGIGNEEGFSLVVNNKEELIVSGTYTGQNIVFNEVHHLGNFDSSKEVTALYGRKFSFYAKYTLIGELLKASRSNLFLQEDQLSDSPSMDEKGNSYFIKHISPKNRGELENGETYRSKGESDFLLIKKNSEGVIQWVKQFGGRNNDFAKLDVNNNYLTIAVTYRSKTISCSNDIQLNNSQTGYESVGVIRMSLDGEPIWATDVPFRGKASVTQLIISENGETFLAGNTGIASNGFLAKIGTSGELIWSSKIGGVGYDYLSSVYIDGAQIYVLGAFKSSIWKYGFVPGYTSSPRPRGGRDLFFLSIDANDGTTKKFLQLGGRASESSATFSPISDGLVLCRYGKPGLYLTKISFNTIQQIPDGYSFKELYFQDYKRTGELISQPDYSYISESSEPPIKNRRRTANMNTSNKNSSDGNTANKSSETDNSNLLNEVDQTLKKAEKKVRGWGKKLKNLSKGN